MNDNATTPNEAPFTLPSSHNLFSTALEELQSREREAQCELSEFSMEDFRSKSCGHGTTQMASYNGGSWSAGPASSGVNGMQDLRCYRASYASSVHPQQQTQAGNNGEKFRKGKSANGKSWSLSDPELQRKKRVASYKVYTVEGKLKGSLRKSFQWLKETCNRDHFLL